MIVRYPSIVALRAAYLATDGARGHKGASAWYNDESPEATLRYAEVGNTALVPAAEALLASFDAQIETPRRQWEPTPAGAFVSVPDFLSGRPTCMRRLREVPDDRAPLTILVSTTSSAALDAGTLAKRGTAILALVMALSRIRPTSLHQLSTLHGRDTGETVLTAEINTTPLDLATACYVLTSSGFDRRLTHHLGKALNGFNGWWPTNFNFNYHKPERYFSGLVLRLGLRPETTLVIPAARRSDALLTNPIAWVKEQVKRFTEMEEAET